MAWTTPKTWVTQDPLNATVMNTHLRDNLNALKLQTDDAEAKLARSYVNPLLHRAVIGINQDISITSTSFVVWHAKCKLTFTPKTNLVIFGVHCTWRFTTSNDSPRRYVFGLKKGNADVSLDHTDILDGSLGSTSELAFDSPERNSYVLLSYQAPVPVTRDTEVSISPTVKAPAGGLIATLLNPSVMILTALDVGAYE